MNDYAIQDPNQFPALIAHSGTSNAAETRRVTVTNVGSANGLDVNILGGTINAGTTVTVDHGTIDVNVTQVLGSAHANENPVFTQKSRSSSFSYNQITLRDGRADQIISQNSARKSVAFVHQSSDPFYIGFDDGVNETNGFPLLANQTITFDEYTGELYGYIVGHDTTGYYLEVTT